MFRRYFCGILALVLTLSSAPMLVAAQADSGQIVITVGDAASKLPIPLARVLLDGPVITSEYSGQNGAVKFTEVPDGIYRARIFKRGYQSVTSEQFEVSNGRAIAVAVVLAKSEQLKEIGSITVKSSATVSTSAIGETSAQRRLSSTLADALNKLSGVSVNTASSDSDATQTVSLEGHDPSQTALTLDGIPLNAPGSAGDLRQIGTDLFRGANVSFGPQNGGLGGGVNFRTLEPTLAWQGTGSVSAGSFGKYSWSLAETGSIGKLGVALQHSVRSTPSLANGLRYLDASGLTYEHDAINQTDSDLVKLRYRLNNQTLSGTFLDTNASNGILCLQISGALPCGYGPDNTTNSRFSLFSLSDSALIGQTAFQAAIFQNAVRFDRDLLNRFLNGIPDPTGSLTDSTTRGFSLSAVLPAKERHTISISANSMSTASHSTPLIASARPYLGADRSSTYASVTLNDSIQSSTKLRLNDHVGLNHTTNAPTSVLAGVNANWAPTANDTYTAAYDIGGVAARAGFSGALSDPHSLRFDCNGHIAYGSAAGDDPTASSSTSARLSVQHRVKSGTLNGSVYRQVQNGTLLTTQVNGSILAPGLPANYFNVVQNVYDSPGGCNAGAGAPFGSTNVYFSVPLGNVQQVYQGAQLAANLTFGNLNVQPYYNITSVVVHSADRRINNPYSIITPGSQVPNTPLHRAGITLDYKAPRSAMEGLFSAQYTGPNNGQNLPAYTVVDAGVNAHFSHGDLTFAANNIFNAFGGIFATNSGAVPYVTQSGLFVPTIARPNVPREYSVTYTVPFGLGARTAQRPTLASQIGEREGGPPGPGGPGGRRGFGFTPLPATPPADVFALNTASALCTPEVQKTVQPMIAQLRAYVAKIEAAKTPNGYPPSVAGAPEIAGTAVRYHQVGKSYALSFDLPRGAGRGGATVISVSGNGGALAALACLPIHIAQPEDVQTRGLYQAPATPGVFFRPSITFMPAVGFYFARPQEQPGQPTFRLYKLPTTPPKNAFAVRSGDACTGQILATAQRMITELQGYFVAGKPLHGWKATPHTAPAGTWYELTADDLESLPALLNCGRVATGTAEEIKAAGFDAAPLPAFNYTSKLGIYMTRPQGGPGLQLRQRPSDQPAPAASPTPRAQ